MGQAALKTDSCARDRDPLPALASETRQRLGAALRTVYETTLDTQPIPDAQVDLLLRLRHKERELRRGA